MAERNCKKCFHYGACKEIAYHNGYSDVNYSESECRLFLPTANVVEVVRCRDCKYREIRICAITGNEMLSCDYSGIAVAPTHYCSYGERRGDK